MQVILIHYLISLFSPFKCHIYTAFGNEAYFQAVGKLRSHGVPFRARSHPDTHASNQYFPRTELVQFDIYVKLEDEHRAQAAIHSSN